jgi:ABC-type Fe3+ transport system permease subunit
MLIRGMGLSDTLLALILPAIPTAFGTFLMRQYFLGLPSELAEAAAIDGAGPFRTFTSIYAPLAMPGLAIVGILAFNYHWNEFFRPLILTISEQNFTLPLGLVTLQGNLGTGSVSTVLAGVVLSMIPALVVFFVGQRPLREGLTAGTSKLAGTSPPSRRCTSGRNAAGSTTRTGCARSTAPTTSSSSTTRRRPTTATSSGVTRRPPTWSSGATTR